MFSKPNLSYFFLFLIFILSISTFAQTDFEGKVVMRISDDQDSNAGNIDYFIKGNKMRMEMKSEDAEIFILYDQKDSKTLMVMPEQKMYMEFPLTDYVNDDMKTGNKSNIQKTGETKTINGYECEKWIIKDEESEVEAWMTDGLGNFFMMTNPMVNSSQDSWQKELQGNYFPMKVDVIEDGEKKTSMEVLSVNRMSLGADLFSIPKGFQKFDMPSMDSYK